jgi:HAD superfamily hydrolase (TIGR01490 family)
MSQAGSTPRVELGGGGHPQAAIAAIAAIDVDGTLFSERAAQYVFLGILRSTGLLGRSAFARLVTIYVAHRLRLIDSVTARLRGVAVLDGLPLAQAELLAERLSAALLSTVRPEARAEIAALRARGLRVMLVSASLGLVVRRLAEGLGADGYLASELLVADGRCRGAFAGPVLEGRQKWLALSRYADERFGRGGWKLAAAYGDSADDVALLERAEQAVAVNAHHKLARAATRRGWRQVAWQ